MAVLPGTLVDRVAEILTRYSMVRPASKIGVAVSGGADSIALLHILKRLSSSFSLVISVLHVNHQLRGVDSDGDEVFVRQMAETLGLPFIAKRTSGAATGNLEESARNERREFFQQTRLENGLEVVALGHTRSDQAETILFRLLRGSGLAGLAGMRFVSADGLIRPLLTTTRDEIRNWAAGEGLSWREDFTNLDTNFARNRLRLKTIPVLTRDFNPNLEAVLSGIATVAQAEENYWRQEIREIAGQLVSRGILGWTISVSELRSLPLAVQRRLVRHVLAAVRGNLRSIDMQHVESILALCDSFEGHNRGIVPGADAIRSFGTLLLARPGTLSGEKRNYELRIEFGQVYDLPYGAGHLCLGSVNSGSQFCVNFKEEPDFPTESVDLNADAFSSGNSAGPIQIRNWQPGDEIERPGHQRPEKLKTLFQEHKVLLWERRHWPVLVSGGKIVWVRQFGCADRFKARPGDNVLRLKYRQLENNEDWPPV